MRCSPAFVFVCVLFLSIGFGNGGIDSIVVLLELSRGRSVNLCYLMNESDL